MNRTATVACLAGAGTAPELMAEATLALTAVARLHGLLVEDVHAPFGAVAVARAGQAFPAPTRATVLAADAVLVAGADDPALAEVMAELDLRARVTRVRFGDADDVALVAPLSEQTGEWALEAAFQMAEARELRLAAVGDETWHDLARQVGDQHEHVHVEHLSPKVAVPLAAFHASRFDVVAVSDRWAEPMIEIAAAPAAARVAAHGLLAEHGPSLFMPSPDGGFGLAGEAGGSVGGAAVARPESGGGVVNPSSMLLAAALALEYGLGEAGAAATLAGAVSAALVDGPRTPDLLARGLGATTREFTSRVLSGFQLSLRNAEFWAGRP
ncbi:MAG TPA: isocitrate/isopropylmalate family dehydrogenase [Gaiellaceae bacterium]|nr:isocitrate/isopropylmalate family dehydrogenase [Gaiellaceae bacterium]